MSKSKFGVIVGGQPRWVPVLSSELSEMGVKVYEHPGLRNSLRHLKFGAAGKFFFAKILHWLYPHMEPVRLLTLAKKMKKKVVVHWIGTDVLELRDYITLNKCLPKFLIDVPDIHLADSPSLQEELAELGISTEVIRLLPQIVDADVEPLPDKPAVLAYFSGESRQEFYGCRYILSLARELPDIPFYVVGSGKGELTDVSANVSFLGEVTDMESVYRKITAFVRFIQHDSLSAMILEALARGKYVFYSQPFPHTTRLINIQNGITALKKALSATTPNWEGAAYVRENFSWRQEIQKLKDIYNELLSKLSHFC